MKMKDLSDYVGFKDEKYWIDAFIIDGDQWPTPFEVGVPFEFTLDGVTRIGVVECDDGAGKFKKIPFTVV